MNAVHYSARRRYCDAGHTLVAGICLSCTFTRKRAERVRRRLRLMKKQGPPTGVEWTRRDFDGKTRSLPHLLGDWPASPSWVNTSGVPQ